MAIEINDTLGVERQTPRHFSFSEPYWEATRERKLVIQYCVKSGKYQWYPRPISIFTGGRELEWREVSGKGAIFTYTVEHVARPPFAGHTPFVIALVTIDEGVNIMGNLINCALEDVKVGLRVRPAWAPLPDGTNVMMFEPDTL